jgi:hypothetical protein
MLAMLGAKEINSNGAWSRTALTVRGQESLIQKCSKLTPAVLHTKKRPVKPCNHDRALNHHLVEIKAPIIKNIAVLRIIISSGHGQCQHTLRIHELLPRLFGKDSVRAEAADLCWLRTPKLIKTQ